MEQFPIVTLDSGDEGDEGDEGDGGDVVGPDLREMPALVALITSAREVTTVAAALTLVRQAAVASERTTARASPARSEIPGSSPPQGLVDYPPSSDDEGEHGDEDDGEHGDEDDGEPHGGVDAQTAVVTQMGGRDPHALLFELLSDIYMHYDEMCSVVSQIIRCLQTEYSDELSGSLESLGEYREGFQSFIMEIFRATGHDVDGVGNV